MPKKDKAFKAATTREAPKYFFWKTDEEKYLPRYPMIYSEKGLGKYTKDFDVFYELYIEQNPVLEPAQAFIYRHLFSLANRGLAISLKNYARYVLHCRHNALIDHLDRLQDARLLYRVCRVDTQGRPNDIVLQTPLSRERWNVEGAGILKDVETHCTRIIRRELGKAWPGDDFKFSQKKIESAFGGQAKAAEEFTILVLDLLFQLHSKKWSGREARKLFEEQLMQGAERKQIFIDEPKFLAALEIQKRYARDLFKVV